MYVCVCVCVFVCMHLYRERVSETESERGGGERVNPSKSGRSTVNCTTNKKKNANRTVYFWSTQSLFLERTR